MPRVLADVNVDRHLHAILSAARADEWRDLWQQLNVEVFWFEDFSIARDTSDNVVWRLCQERQLVLVTGNRSAKDQTSLEATIRAEGTVDSLPVLTFSDADRVLTDRVYAEAVMVQLLDYLMDIDRLRGSGRLFLP